jgi:hypothetical protein
MLHSKLKDDVVIVALVISIKLKCFMDAPNFNEYSTATKV